MEEKTGGDQRQRTGFNLLMVNSFIYIGASVYAPFLSAYYATRGISAAQIGVLLAVGPVVSILIQPLWAWLSDHTGRRKRVLEAVALGTAAACLFYYLGTGFAFFFAAAILYTSFGTSLVPLSDAVILRQAERHDLDFAKIRMGGTVGYAVTAFLAGFYLKGNPGAQFLLAAGGYLVLFLFIRRLPGDTAPERARPREEEAAPPPGRGIFDSGEVVFVLLFAFLSNAGLTFLTAFLGVYALELGYTQSLIGGMNFVSAMSEVPILLCIGRILRRFGPIPVLAFSCGAMCLRILLASGGTVPLLLLSQGLQSVTYMTVYYSCTTYVGRHVLPGRQSRGQSILVMVQAGLGAIAGNLAGGYAVERLGIRGAYRAAALVLLAAAGLVTLGFCLYRRRAASRGAKAVGSAPC